MAVETFPDVPPDWGYEIPVEAAVAEAPFGDGYTQRAQDGLNSLRVTVPLRWTNLVTAEWSSINDFLTARAGYQAFYWTPVGHPQMKWTCKTWRTVPKDYGYFDVTASFRREFDP